MVVVLMGVSGVGKTTVGKALAADLGWTFVEADDFHPPANVEKMRAGIALTDADRVGWLQTLGRTLADSRAAESGVVLACSALKRSYRDALRSGDPDLRLVFLHGSRELLAARIGARRDHYMPPSLLDSQLAALEAPAADEQPITIDIAADPANLVAEIVRRLRERGDG